MMEITSSDGTKCHGQSVDVWKVIKHVRVIFLTNLVLAKLTFNMCNLKSTGKKKFSIYYLRANRLFMSTVEQQ